MAEVVDTDCREGEGSLPRLLYTTTPIITATSQVKALVLGFGGAPHEGQAFADVLTLALHSWQVVSGMARLLLVARGSQGSWNNNLHGICVMRHVVI